MNEVDWMNKLQINKNDYNRIRDIIGFYTWYSSLTRDVGTDSLTGFLGMVSHWSD